MRSKANVYVVDDDDPVRDSLCFQLEMAGYRSRGFASAVAFLREAGSLPEGCLILDVRMPEMDGLELQRRLAERDVHFPIIMVTGHGDVPIAVRAMKAGAVDFIEKPFSEDAIFESIELAQSRKRSPAISDEQAEQARRRIAPLSRREHEVMQGLVAGQQNKEIAFDLGLSVRTVEVHRARLMDKTQVRGLSELVHLALLAGVPIK